MTKKHLGHTQVLFKEQIKQIAREYGSKKGAKELGNELGVSKQRIQQVAAELRKRGVKVPYMRLKVYGDVVKELKKESPELF